MFFSVVGHNIISFRPSICCQWEYTRARRSHLTRLLHFLFRTQLTTRYTNIWLLTLFSQTAVIAKKPTGMRLHVRCNKANFSSPGVCLHQLLIGRADDICWIIIVEATPPTDVYSSGWVPADVTVWVFLTPCTC